MSSSALVDVLILWWKFWVEKYVYILYLQNDPQASKVLALWTSENWKNVTKVTKHNRTNFVENSTTLNEWNKNHNAVRSPSTCLTYLFLPFSNLASCNSLRYHLHSWPQPKISACSGAEWYLNEREAPIISIFICMYAIRHQHQQQSKLPLAESTT